MDDHTIEYYCLCTHAHIHTVLENRNPVDELVFLHLPAVMGVMMRTWHLLDIKKHITLSDLSLVCLFPCDLDHFS